MKRLLIVLLLFCFYDAQSQSPFTVLFDFNKYTLTSRARSQLDSFLLAEKQNLSRMSIRLYGHCDAIGSDEYNNRLSGKRVAAVRKYLLDYGLQKYNIGDEKGFGEKAPLNQNGSAEERQLNRRVEISFIELSPPGLTTLKEKIADSSVTTGTNIVLRNINFVGGMHQFLPESMPMLEELLDAMRTYPNLAIRVEGHICCHEDSGDGMDLETGINNLSAARAKAVRDYLIENNIPATRVTSIGFGHQSPIYPYPERTEEEKTGNRRVEIKIIRK